MNLRAALAAALWLATPLSADVLDDAACGVIGEYALDLAYDAGVPAALAPDGTTGADEQGCFVTGLILSPDGPSGLRIGYLGWSGEGLEDWVSGHGLPLSLNMTLEGAYLETRIPDHPAYEWSTNVINRRNLISGDLSAAWDPKAGRLKIKSLTLRNPNNAITLAAEVGGIAPEPSQLNPNAVSLHGLDVQIDMAGAFETLLLTPFTAGLMADVDDPEAAFDSYIELARGYLAALQEPQFDADTISALNRFLSSLPSPTGRLTVQIDLPDGVSLGGVFLQMALIRSTNRNHVGLIISRLIDPGTFRATWQPAAPR